MTAARFAPAPPPRIRRPRSRIPKKGVHSAPEYVVGTETTGKPVSVDTALPRSIALPPPIGSSASAVVVASAISAILSLGTSVHRPAGSMPRSRSQRSLAITNGRARALRGAPAAPPARGGRSPRSRNQSDRSTGHFRRTHGQRPSVLRSASQAMLRDGFEISTIGSTGHFRRTHGQSPSVLKSASQATLRDGFEISTIGSTGHFRRSHGQSPSVLRSASQATLRDGFEISTIGSTGHFRRSHGQSPSVLR